MKTYNTVICNQTTQPMNEVSVTGSVEGRSSSTDISEIAVGQHHGDSTNRSTTNRKPSDMETCPYGSHPSQGIRPPDSHKSKSPKSGEVMKPKEPTDDELVDLFTDLDLIREELESLQVLLMEANKLQGSARGRHLLKYVERHVARLERLKNCVPGRWDDLTSRITRLFVAFRLFGSH